MSQSISRAPQGVAETSKGRTSKQCGPLSFIDSVKYAEAEERKNVMPSLFDLIDAA